LQLLPSLDNTVTIVAVHDENDTLGVLEIMSPQRTDLVLTTDIPHGELNVLVLDSLDVEAYSEGAELSAACITLGWLTRLGDTAVEGGEDVAYQ
jgi:hypothetical protein